MSYEIMQICINATLDKQIFWMKILVIIYQKNRPMRYIYQSA